MYLKSIEVQGFKSFANKIVFEFRDGITAIVGPNGSGKSNVADAVRWVLGEQSAKQLRGNRMEDVIFSGTELRRPLGFAYVAITLNNADHMLPLDYEEVTVARRVYRSGESEYLLNGSVCRLKDIQELFLDTGIGKEGYSIIGQGQIDKVLSGRPEERRELFDEAAGIVKFKKRKAAAEKNLEEERLNLSRVSDILGEIEKQLEPLEKQSATAKEFLKYKEELKRLEINLFLAEQERQAAAKRKLEEKYGIAEEELSRAREAYDSTRKEYDRLEGELAAYAAEIEEKRAAHSGLQLAVQKKEGEIGLLKEQISSVRQNETHYKERLETVARALSEKRQELDGYAAQKKEADGKRDALLAAQADAEKESAKIKERIAAFSAEIEAANGRMFDLLNENGTLKTGMERHQTIKEQNMIKKAELNRRMLRNESEKAEAAADVEEGKSRLEEISGRILALTQEGQAAEQALEALQKELGALSSRIEGKQREYLAAASKAESLKNLSERYDGYGGSIRRVMEQKDKTPGIIGVVADILQADKKYETAVETALGGSIQNIVTDTEETAKRLIGFLKQNKFGRATFLPLTGITAREKKDADVSGENGVLGYASELVHTESRFGRLVEYLLGRILVVDTIDHALALARKYRYTLRIVTLEGEQLNPGGSLSGGAYKNSSGLLGRRREAEEAAGQAAVLKQEWEKLLSGREEARTKRQALREQAEERAAALQALLLEQNTAKLYLNRQLEREAGCAASYEEIQKEMEELELQDTELEEQLKNLSLSLEKNEEEERRHADGLEEANRRLEEEHRSERDAGEKGESLRLELSAVEQNSRFLLENIRRLTAEAGRLREEETALTAESGSTAGQIREREEAILAAKAEIAEKTAEAERLEKEAFELSDRREKTAQSHRAFFDKRESLSEQKAALDKELFRLNAQKEKAAEQMEAQNNYMWEEYGITLSTAEEYREENFGGEAGVSQARKKTGELRGKIKELGTVNVNAIEDFKNLSERHAFLSAQREDLKEAEETLITVIAELDEEMRKQFAGQFAAIRTQFDAVFKELFGGGKGTLALQEDEDILDAGICIIAQPPGKKLQNMMQLSGGEKALTAIALLFAIQNLKPSPFCLLDEIEAALDDSNVTRYAKYLHKLTKDTQFIVITHRRGTMAAADVLYGITMQEKGVSALVSVSLIEDELDA